MRRRYGFVSVLLGIALLLSSIGGCSGGDGQNVPKNKAQQVKPLTLTVSAAGSLRNALDEIKEVYEKEHEGVELKLNIGSSGSLQQQIEQGAPVDLFISAATRQMDALKEKGLLQEGTLRNLLSNRVVLIAPAGTGKISGFRDLTAASIKKIAIGDPATVPCGAYARQILTNLGIFDQLKNKLVLCKDVTQVLAYVGSGNVDAGIVFWTDAQSSKSVKAVETAAESLHDRIIYPVAVIKSGKNRDAARDLETFLFSSEAKEIFKKYGFVVLGE